MSKQIDALKLALEALELTANKFQKQRDAITAIKEALAQPEQEHVGVVGSWKRNENGVYITTILGMVELGFDDKVYTTPPHRKPLTHEQRFDLLTKFEPHKNKWEAPAILIDMVEAAHGIKE